ncbi:MerR family transcriptional regulator [Piscinibacter sp. HJYY11]|uniref:MerR family transcriptional regulator n=1 Tax=Piscinibacter sp. HJYY11 TaxID=2801333 RepID=UPI00191CAE0F|nr:MerR family transcriptional regulator [Piscinibacter sp. HJYY11]MBL0728586.1 MerR family transcriptional regulator [Piscinibacter sp. HJYY11]
MQIGELAQRAGVSRDALRLYESAGLIESTRRDNGYREYTEDTVVRLLLIRTGQRLGLSLAQIGEAAAGLNGITDVKQREAAVTQLLRAQLERVDQQLQELQALKQELVDRLESGCPLS